MRYPPGKLPEIISTYCRDNLYFASIRVARGGIDLVFELGITPSSYSALKRVFQSRHFDAMPGACQRYFFVPVYSKRDDPDRCIGTIRIEQGKNAQNLELEMPKTLIANLLWFYEMDNLDQAQHLRSWLPDDSP